MMTANGNGRALSELTVHDGALAALGEAFAERRMPTPLPEPYLVAFNPDAAALAGLDRAEAANPTFTLLAAGNAIFQDRPPSAAIYAGHQFGVFVSQLGDGRALSLGEVENEAGERWDWQLKGAGMTACSRFADARCCARRSASIFAARRCTRSEFRRRVRSRLLEARCPSFANSPRRPRC
jgi:uncharacterized protein YdiU (UPF0061 family)